MKGSEDPGPTAHSRPHGSPGWGGGPHAPGIPERPGPGAGGLWWWGYFPGDFVERTLLRGPN